MFHEHNRKIILVADCVRKDPNISGLIRLGDAIGAEAVYFVRHRPGQLHAAAGAQRFVTLRYEPDGEFLNHLRLDGYQIVGIEIEDRAVPYNDVVYKGKVALIVGSETNGIRKPIAAKCDVIVKIPQYGQVNSLNVVGAAHVVAYKALEQWKIQ